MYRWDAQPANIYWDTMIGAFILNENETTHGLKPLYAKYITKTVDEAGVSYALKEILKVI